ncbi:MAG TPA: N-acetyltransferase [Gemmatimonadales bacterium]|nr:N-acetyltransferase [Gemmatimonadales bacterium]
MIAVEPPALEMRPHPSRAIQTITQAFVADPVCRWCWPDLGQYLAAMPAFTEAFGGRAFQSQTAFCTADYRAVALWLPPETGIDEGAVEAVLQASIEADRRAELYQLFEEMARYHPTESHWYLPLIGVDPAAQGQGYGARLLRLALERCDREGTVAYLEATSDRNIPLYQRHGFQVAGRIQVGSSPPLTPMLREPGGGRSSRPRPRATAA